LHSIEFPAFGELTADGAPANAAPYAAALAERARLFIKSERLRDLFLSALEQNAALFADVRQPCLCHEDLHQHNILFQFVKGHWHLAAILDFDKAWAGHGESDLARMEFWKGMTDTEFWRAYELVRPIEPLYQQRRLVHQLFWCLEYARPTKEHLADTRRLCVELGLEPIQNF
jgi:fructosamine-3-kinase